MADARSPAEIEAARKLFAGPCEFVAGAASFESLIPISLPEIAFAGRSNVGKSSLVNALTGRRTLARTSSSPGHTRQINFFNVKSVAGLDLKEQRHGSVVVKLAVELMHAEVEIQPPSVNVRW
jgi:hypothetical protein